MKLNLPLELIDEAVRLSGQRSRAAVVARALNEFIARRRQGRLLELFGQLDWDPDLDYKAERTRR